MKSKQILLLLIGTLGIFICSCEFMQTDPEGTTDPITEVESEGFVCNASWFPHSQTPPPEEGKGSPFDTTSTTNIIFQEWAWQKFLFLTKPEPNGLPFFLNEYYKVDDNMNLLGTGKDPLMLEYTEQAGSDGELLSNAQFNAENGTSATVYYSLHISKELHLSADQFKRQLVTKELPLNNNKTFPVGAVELKVSWVNVEAIPSNERNNYYTTTAIVEPSGESKTMAFLGMHVVGVVENHPEFIWATFEHDNMAPLYDWTNTTTSDIPVTSANQKLFFEQGAEAGLADITWDGTKPAAAQNVFDIYKLGVPRLAGNEFMTMTSQDGKTNYDNIEAINACVKENLKDVFQNYFLKANIWFNTDGQTPAEQVAMIEELSNAGSYGSAAEGSPTRGSLAAANITMETYVQYGFGTKSIHAMDVSSLMNCMVCHTGKARISLEEGTTPESSVSPLYISHLFRNHVSHHSGVPKDEFDMARTVEFMNTMKRKENK